MRTKYDYTALDAAIVKVIGEREPAVFNDIHVGEVHRQCKKIADVERAACETKWARDHVADWRVLDRRLQALRKKGVISHSRKPEGWSLVKEGGAE